MLVHSFYQLKQIEDPQNNIVITDCFLNNTKLINICNFIKDTEAPFQLEENINFHKNYSRQLFHEHEFLSPYIDVKLFLDHVNDIIYKYANLFNLTSFKVRLELLNNNTCILFHHDHIDKRLICTLAGSGTEYLDNDNINWDSFHKTYLILEEKNKAIVKDWNKVKQLQQLEIAVMKGCNSNSDNGLIHKSPYCDNNNRRLVLIIG